jgi:penicillin-binding protein 2
MRDRLLQLLIISVGLLVLVKLFSLQVLNSSFSLINNNASVQKIYEFPERGYIYDRNNKLIVSNDFSYDLLVVPKDVNLADSIEISEDFNIDLKVFRKKFLEAKSFSNVKA